MTMLTPKVAIIILQYNNSKATLACLESLAQINYVNYKIFLVDNASDQYNFNNIRLYVANHPSIVLLANSENLGYAHGNNCGIKAALKEKFDYYLILNNDTIVKADFLAKLVIVGEANSTVGILGPALIENYDTTFGGKVNWLKLRLKQNNINLRGNILKKGYYLPGTAFLIKRAVIEKIGYINEYYFLYFEDAEYCLKAKKYGFNLALVPEAEIHHQVSGSSLKLGIPLIFRYHARNALYFNLKCGPFWVKLALPFWSILIIIKQTCKIIFLSDKRQISKAILAGVIDFYLRKNGKITNSEL